jgi:hypothetical protein
MNPIFIRKEASLALEEIREKKHWSWKGQGEHVFYILWNTYIEEYFLYAMKQWNIE